MRLIFWPIMIAILAGVAYMIWRDLSEGRWLKVLVIGSAVTFFTWRSYAQVKKAARS